LALPCQRYLHILRAAWIGLSAETLATANEQSGPPWSSFRRHPPRKALTRGIELLAGIHPFRAGNTTDTDHFIERMYREVHAPKPTIKVGRLPGAAALLVDRRAAAELLISARLVARAEQPGAPRMAGPCRLPRQ
jgi:fido (protein-threonine AMPylation protein)